MMPQAINGYFNKYLSNQPAFLFLGTAWLVLSLASAWFLPPYLGSVFNGPDGTLWAGPFSFCAGISGSAFLFSIPYIYRKFGSAEAVAAWGILAAFGTAMLFVAFQRFSSGLFHIESFHATMGLRLINNLPLYCNPEITSGGTIYPPLYYMLSGVLHLVLPATLSGARLISIISTVASTILVYSLAKKLGANRISAIWGVCVFAATYGILHKLYDMAFVDPLLMCLTAATLLCLVKNTPAWDMAAVILSVAACFTKQTAAPQTMAVILLLALSRRRLWVYLPLAAGAAAGALLIWATHNWAIVCLMGNPVKFGWHGFPYPKTLLMIAGYQLPVTAGAIITIFAGLKSSLQTVKQQPQSVKISGILSVLSGPYARVAIFSSTVAVSSFLGLIHAGGWINVIMPVEPLVCAAGAAWLSRKKLLLVIQLAVGIYNPFTTIYPWASIRDVNRHAIDAAKKVTGSVWFPIETELAFAADKEPWDNVYSLMGWVQTGHPLPARLVDAIENKRFDLILVKSRNVSVFEACHPDLTRMVNDNYEKNVVNGLAVYIPVKADNQTKNLRGK